MKKRSRFLIGFTAAAVTFVSLFAIAGPRHFGGPFGSHHAFQGNCQMNENEHIIYLLGSNHTCSKNMHKNPYFVRDWKA